MQQPHESGYLLLDSSKSRTELNWTDLLDFSSGVKWTTSWYQNDALESQRTKNQIKDFINLLD